MIAVNCDWGAQAADEEMCSGSHVDIVFATIHELRHVEPSPSELILLCSSHKTDTILEMVPAIKASRSGAEVIVLSRCADETLWCKALSLGACDLLALPLERNEFRLAIAKARPSEEREVRPEHAAIA